MAKTAKSKTLGQKNSSGPKKEGEYRSGPIEGTAIISGATFSRKGLQYAEVDGYAMFEGDIILGRIDEIRDHIISDSEIAHAVVVTGPQVRWPNATIPYEIATNVTNQQRITDAIAHWEANTCIRFILRTPQNAGQHPDFVLFQTGSGCSSNVGRRLGQQIITLGPSCTTGNTIHEIGHTVGLWHEQSREDRDQFIRIVWANIDPAMQHNFSQHITDGEDIGNYDYGSIMHYSRDAFSNNNQDTIIPLQTLPAGVVMGQRNGLSQGDINAIRTIYCGGLPFVPPFTIPFRPPFLTPFLPPFVAPFRPPFWPPFQPPFVAP
ncbi:Dot/Icm T4SS effector Zinc-dependent metalloprotease LegP, partial [Flavitalea sp.]|nr:Dot/Icm T4SS effector Zinc-dependent metalloprotease LegP [Flavitalea sp.]